MAYVLVVGDEAHLRADDGAAKELARLGAEVRACELFGPFEGALEDGAPCRAIIVECGDRPDLATLAIRGLKRESALDRTPIMVAVPERQVARLDPTAGFDDFIVVPYFATELYARIRMLEWRTSEFMSEERVKMGDVVVDVAAHEVRVSGRAVALTAREFALLVFFIAARGRVFSREALLARVWGARYDGGARTVDIHVRRLRAKLGDALPLETVRGSGYKLRMPTEAAGDDVLAQDDVPEPLPLARAGTRTRARSSLSKAK